MIEGKTIAHYAGKTSKIYINWYFIKYCRPTGFWDQWLRSSRSGTAGEAELVFCPYNYLVDPVIRKSMDVDIDRAVLIFDEAHNIEDNARQAWYKLMMHFPIIKTLRGKVGFAAMRACKNSRRACIMNSALRLVSVKSYILVRQWI